MRPKRSATRSVDRQVAIASTARRRAVDRRFRRSCTNPSRVRGWARCEPRSFPTMSDAYTPIPDDHFTFGLWTVGNPGRDPFGHEVRPPLDPVDSVHRLAELGAYGVNFHDDDLVPSGLERRRARGDRQAVPPALDETGHEGARWPPPTCSRSPVFKDGAFTANDPAVRRFAVRKTLRRHRPRRRARRRGLRDVGRARGRGGRRGQGHPRRARPLRRGRRTCAAPTSASAATTCGSRSSPSPTSRAATSSSRRSAMRSRSSTSSSGPRWSG